MASDLRINGIVTGFDTESMVKELIKVEYTKVDKVKQEKTYAGWQKDAYRDVTNLLRGLKDTFFDILKPTSSLRSPSLFNVFEASVSSSAVSVSATSAAQKGTHVINNITQLATKHTYSSNNAVKGEVTGSNYVADAANAGGTFQITFDGVTKDITLEAGTYSDIASLNTALSAKISTAFSGKVTSSVIGDAIQISSGELGHKLKVSATDATFLNAVGLQSGQKNYIDNTDTLEQAFGVVPGVTMDFTINDETFSFASTTTVSEMMTSINTSDAGVTMSYSSVADKFTMVSNKEGVLNAISFTDEDNFLIGALDFVETQEGKDAEFSLDGISTSRSSNTFTEDGITYTLKETTATAINVDVTFNPDTVVDKLKSFVEKYNEILTHVNGKTSEKKYLDYKPLTDDERESMEESDIELWEEKAKSGLLRSDALLNKLTTTMRQMLSETVEGVGISLRDIGITTSTNYKDGGKLVIDEEKLTTALEENPTEIIALFTNESDKAYSDSANRVERNSENGLGNRLNDILNDFVRTTRDSNGKKGLLIEKAGITNDASDYLNEIEKKLTTFDERIDDLLDLIADKEDRYYSQFARMESVMSMYESQSSWLTQQLGGA
jgi:flagellar hook-associated protein 2